MTNEIANYQADHLMLLLGSNPLPNYVAAKLLINFGGTIHLVISKEMLKALGKPDNTDTVIERFKELLVNYQFAEDIVVEALNPDDIFQEISCRVKKYEGQWGLNYTGGKKLMSTHVHRAMEKTLSIEEKPPAFYSYLDADTLTMVFDGIDGRVTKRIPVNHLVKMSIPELVFLQGQTRSIVDIDNNQIVWKGKELTKQPFQSDACENLLVAWVKDDFLINPKMIDWRDNNLSFNINCDILFEIYCKNSSKTLNDEWLRELLILTCKKDPLAKLSKNKCEKKILEKLESLEVPMEVMNIGGKTLGELSKDWNLKIEKLIKWFHGDWLEHYVLKKILDLKLDSINVAQDIEAFPISNLDPDNFQSDVLAVIGYQLYYFSVTTDTEKPRSKLKLFEAFIRAQQLGGDEAQVCLVTFYKDPEKLENEMREEFGTRTNIRVFGPKHLRNFDIYLKEWFS